MKCIEDRDVVLELEKSKKHHRGSARCGQETLVAQGRGRCVLTIILLFLYNTREGEAQRMKKGALKNGLIKNGN